MTLHSASKLKTLAIVARFVSIVAILTAYTTQAQQTDASRPSGKLSVFEAQEDGAPSQPWKRRVSPDAVPSQDPFPGRWQTRGATSVAAASQGVSFLPPMTSISGCLPWAIAVGDVNGDGHPDLVVANWYQGCTGTFSTGEVSVLLGNGDGTFQAPVSYSSGGFQALGIAIGDVNGDGKLDLVVANDCAGNGSGECADGGAGQVGVLLGNGDGTFQPAVSYFSGGAIAQSVVIADVNRDGHPDLIVGNYCEDLGGDCDDGSLGVLLGNGDGTFQPAVTYTAGYLVVSEAVADVNGDGRPDVIVVGGQEVGVVSVLLGNGDGTFQPEVSYNWGGYEPDWVAIADVNGDGRPDLVVASYCVDIDGPCNSGNLGVMFGNGDGTFQAPVSYSSGGFTASSVAIADVNGDGHLDLIVATLDPNGPNGLGPGELGVLLGNGDGTFQEATEFPSGGETPLSVVAADVNGDGKPDLLVANVCENGLCNGMSPGSVGVLLNNAGITQGGTSTTLMCSPNPSAYGQSVICTATVSAARGTPTGTVILYDGATPIGNAKLAKRKAVIPVSSLAVGSHSIMSVYQGSSSFAPSTSASLNQVVGTAPTTVSLASSANPAAIEQLITFTATVIGQYSGGTATGTMTFQNGGKTVATVQVNDNQASYSKAYPGRGVRSITAIYSGDSNNGGSTSPTFMEAVGSTPYPTTTTVTTSGSPSLVGQAVTFTATVSFAGNAIPNGGTVTFYDGSAEIGTSTTTGGLATFTTSSLKAKTHTIKATYAGDATFKASRGAVTQVVNN
jgi:hypothetical protein